MSDSSTEYHYSVDNRALLDNKYQVITFLDIGVRGMTIPDNSHEMRLQQMLEKLKKSDFRITPQRYAVLRVLANSSEHPSAESIHAELIEHYPTMSLATVYKTIKLLKREGELLILEFSDLGNRYDGKKPYPHPHVICTQCGKIIDPSQIHIQETAKKIMAETGFKLLTHRIDFYGICPACQ